MRWISIAAILGVALLPASARPLCRPDRSTTTGLPSATATTSLETLSTDSATATETSAIETTVTTFTESETATATTGFTTVTSAVTSEAATTTSEAPEATNYIQNGGFEDSPNTDWSVRTSDIKGDSRRARSGNKYVQYDVDDSVAMGGNQLNQTVNGLDTERLYRLTAYATVFDTPAPVKEQSTICVIEALQESSSIAQWRLDFTNLGTYQSYSVDFTPSDEDVTVTMRLRCSDGKKVTLSVGLDDVSLYDIGPKLVG
ncbi:uncharacterized protein FSUBG_12790 [Fusarium subglutinans]|uniref:CBM-cenC domain-containing protein n=1 Tax=Gibberella subglutinans TaxID=42677 RepID=A0A8H5L4E9_GIBSU|nr:uncharacterized protein FSUBG_12790 [Fusarium subglutinans]KAF5584418.1 hypothetical protein FSUBG_12790 [Fusarium subglutinans]